MLENQEQEVSVWSPLNRLGISLRGFGRRCKSLLGGVLLTVIVVGSDELKVKPGEGNQ